MRFWIVGVLAAMLGVTFFFSTLRRPRCERGGDRHRPHRSRAPDRSTRSRVVRSPCSAWRAAALPWHASWPIAARCDRLRRPTARRSWQRRSASSRAGQCSCCLARISTRAAALAGQALIATSPSINSRYPTTEPRLRAALADVETAGRVPVVSEVDLFLRLCPAVTIGVTGTKGKTTTSVARRRGARRRTRAGRPGRQHRHPARRATARADARPSRRDRAVGAAAADDVARHRRLGLHAT